MNKGALYQEIKVNKSNVEFNQETVADEQIAAVAIPF